MCICGGSLTLRKLLATEVVKNYHKPSIASRSALKLDISKAFNTIHWTFIVKTLCAMGYPAQFIHWIYMCVSTASFTVLVNGELEGWFTSNRGIQQGCSLSPYLYVIVNNALPKLLNKAAVANQIGYHPGCRGINLTHLSFADDILVFTNGTPTLLCGTLPLNFLSVCKYVEIVHQCL